MRIIIDTELQAIIVPDSYYMQIDKMNAVIAEVGGNKLEYSKYIKTCFDKAFETQIIRNSDIPKAKGTKNKRRANVKKEEDASSPKDEPTKNEGETK